MLNNSMREFLRSSARGHTLHSRLHSRLNSGLFSRNFLGFLSSHLALATALFAFTSHSLAAQSFAALPEQPPTEIGSNSPLGEYLTPDQIALNPVLLKEDHMDDAEMEELLGGAQVGSQAGTQAGNNARNLSSNGPSASSAYQGTGSFSQGRTLMFNEKYAPQPSALEHYYAQRTQSPLRQFGYDLFSSPQDQNMLRATPNQAQGESQGAMADDYILGAGDEVNVLIRGQINFSKTIPLQRDGTLVVEDLAPIQAQGRKIKDVSDEIKKMIGDYYNSDVFLSVSKTRQISVMVSGQVSLPGPVFLSSFATLKEALIKAGGVNKDGTLRRIKILRGESQLFVDLYGLLIYGSNSLAMGLKDGDVIQVDPIGPTLAIAGDVKRPGVYEILPKFGRAASALTAQDSQSLSLEDLLLFSGGPVAPGKLRYIRRSPQSNGAEFSTTVTALQDKIFSNGDVLWVGRDTERAEGSIELMGESRSNGLFTLAQSPDLAHLLKDGRVMGPHIYPAFAVIERWDAEHLAPKLLSFSPERVINKSSNLKLQGGDRIYLFSRDELLNFITTAPRELNQLSFDTTQNAPSPLTDFAPTPDRMESLRQYCLDHLVYVRGAVGREGAYAIADGASIQSVIDLAGGPTKNADPARIELTTRATKTGDEAARRVIALGQNSAALRLHPGDQLRIHQTAAPQGDLHVVIAGEVKSPGTYDLMPGDTLGVLIERAGGLSRDAYPMGAVFSRASERAREEQRFHATARDLELKLSAALSAPPSKKSAAPNDSDIALARDLIADLKNSHALGRLTVQADPEMLKIHPDQDILLEKGDRIYIPKRPSTIRVAGEVLSPAALRFMSGQKAQDYIDQAGGLTHDADADRAFIIYPDGSASPIGESLWSYRTVMITPGSTIIIPRDPKPFDFIEGAKDITQILANLATTAIFADNISD